jgi:hypothetical protein
VANRGRTDELADGTDWARAISEELTETVASAMATAMNERQVRCGGRVDVDFIGLAIVSHQASGGPVDTERTKTAKRALPVHRLFRVRS